MSARDSRLQILAYAAHDSASIRGNLGAADYSYHFVLEAFRPMLEACGEFVRVRDPETEVPARVIEARSRGLDPLYLSFAPPHATVLPADCPVIPVFAWEFATLPDESFSGEWRNDWVEVLRRCGQAITHSRYAAERVRERLGAAFPIAVIPAPVWDRYAPLAQPRPGKRMRRIELDCTVIDSAGLDIDPRRVVPAAFSGTGHAASAGRSWGGEDLDIAFCLGGGGPLVVGFHAPEDWGVWSRDETAWVVLPRPLVGAFRVRLLMAAHDANIGRPLSLRLGNVTHEFELRAEPTDFEFDFSLDAPANLLVIDGMLPSRPDADTDPRFLGVALLSMSVRCAESGSAGSVSWPAGEVVPLDLNGGVYAAIFNPKDGRKNWQDILTAFCIAFRSQADATLILKMTHHDLAAYVDEVFLLMRQLAPFACRVVVLHGFLDDEAYDALTRVTDFIVSASCGEGQCLPLMEYMSAGVPAISTRNTAMMDYVTADDAFLVHSTPEPIYWPQDPRQVLGTLRHRVSWESLHSAFLSSRAMLDADPAAYARMGSAAQRALQAFCSTGVLEPRLRAFLGHARHRHAESPA